MRAGRAERIYVDDLDCLCCGKWFRSFADIGAHLAREYRRIGRRKVAAAITNNLAFWSDRMKFPKPAQQKGDDELPPFLKAKHIGKVGTRATLAIAGKARLHNGTYGEQVLVPVKFGGKAYEFAVGTDKPNYPIMWDLFGDPNKWKGKITVAVVAGMRGNYLAVE